MCYQPIHIRNNKIEFNQFKDKFILEVPCGHCVECEFAKRREWSTRAYYEYLDTMRNKGSVLYVTLTYNNAHLPTYDGIPCFCKRDIQLFMKRIRKHFKVNHIKYFITSEYGGKKHRPHYHGLIYIPHRISPYNIHKRLSDLWQNGFVAGGKYGYFVNGFGAVDYVAKYLYKDLDFDFGKLPKEVHPFHLQSKGFGEYIIEAFNLYDLTSDETFKKLVSGTVVVPDTKRGQRAVFIPQYVSRKLLYDLHYVEENGQKKPRWIINELGKKVSKARFEQQCKNTEQRFCDLYNNITNIINDSERLAMFNRVSHSDFTTASSIRLSLEKVNFRDLSLYVGLYKGLMPCDFEEMFKSSGYELLGVDIPLFSDFAIQYALDVKFGNEVSEQNQDTMVYLCREIDKVSFELERAVEIINGIYYVKGFIAAKEELRKRELNSKLKLLKR